MCLGEEIVGKKHQQDISHLTRKNPLPMQNLLLIPPLQLLISPEVSDWHKIVKIAVQTQAALFLNQTTHLNTEGILFIFILPLLVL